MDVNYRLIDHTADLGVEVYGNNIEVLFINVSKAIFETQIKGTIKQNKQVTIQLQSDTREELLIEWCRELIYQFSVHHFIPQKYELTIQDNELTARLDGDIYDEKRHQIQLEIKNATYHNLALKKTEQGYQATIIFDV